MKCYNCGNKNNSTLHDEGDTIYCSICKHRTNKKTKKDDSVICPVCHYPRDRKALYCRWCNDSTWGKYDKELEKLNKDYQKTITKDNLTYGKYKDFEPENKIDEEDKYYPVGSIDTPEDNVSIGIGLAAIAGFFIYEVGKDLYKKYKDKKKKTNSKYLNRTK